MISVEAFSLQADLYMIKSKRKLSNFQQLHSTGLAETLGKPDKILTQLIQN